MADGVDDPDWRAIAERYQRALLVIASAINTGADNLRLVAQTALCPEQPSNEVRYWPRTSPIPFGWRPVDGVDLGHHSAYAVLIERGRDD